MIADPVWWEFKCKGGGGGEAGGGGSEAADEADVASYGHVDDLDDVVLESSRWPRLAALAAALSSAPTPPPGPSMMCTTMGNTVGWKAEKIPIRRFI